MYWAIASCFKIGMTGNIIRRLSSYDTAEPYSHHLRYIFFTTYEDLKNGYTEQAALSALDESKINPKKEWVGNGVTLETIVKVFSQLN